MTDTETDAPADPDRLFEEFHEAYHAHGEVGCSSCNSKIDLSAADDVSEAIDIAQDHECGDDDPETTTITPDDEAGFTPTDVLEDAEEGDSIYVNFDLPNVPKIEGVQGDVDEISVEEFDDEDLREKKIVIDVDDPDKEGLILWVHSSTTSAYNYIVEKVDIREADEQDWETYDIGHFDYAELTRTAEN